MFNFSLENVLNTLINADNKNQKTGEFTFAVDKVGLVLVIEYATVVMNVQFELKYKSYYTKKRFRGKEAFASDFFLRINSLCLV